MKTIEDLFSKEASVSFVEKDEEVKSVPLINEPDIDYGGAVQTNTNIFDKEILFDYFMQNPEVINPVSTIVTDIISDGYYVRSEKGTDVTDARKQKVETFCKRNRFTTLQESLLFDALITGDAYCVVQDEVDLDFKQKVSDAVSKVRGVRNSQFVVDRVMQSLDEDKPSQNTLVHLPSSTVTIKHKPNGDVQEYIQKVGKKKKVFKPREVIHFKFMPINGRVYGFSPLSSMISELSLIMSIKDYSGYFFSNAGYPNYIFTLPNEHPDSPNVRALKLQLRKFKNMKHKHRDLVFTGEIDATPIGKFDKDMEFQELIGKMTDICVSAWGVPPAKRGTTSETSGAYDSGLATEGYYRRVSHYQMWFYETFNHQFFEKVFGVNLIPKKAYLQDEVRETQTLKQKSDICEQLLKLGLVNEKYCYELLDIPEMFREDPKKKMLEMQQTGQLNQNLQPNKNVDGDIAKQEVNKMRSDTQKEHAEGVKTLDDGGFWTRKEAEAIQFNENL